MRVRPSSWLRSTASISFGSFATGSRAICVEGLSARYKKILTVEDGLIGTLDSGLRGFAGYVASEMYGSGVALDHFGIIDPQIAPSDHFLKVWEHYGITEEGILKSICAR